MFAQDFDDYSNFFSKAYGDYPNSKKLYYRLPEYLKLKLKILQAWRKVLSFDAQEVEFPTLMPTKILEKSGHKSAFKDELFEIVGSGLILRPETVAAIFPQLRALRCKIGKNPLKIAQTGKSYRNERTTRDGAFRLKEFDQMEIISLTSEKNSFDLFVEEYKKKTKRFFFNFRSRVYLCRSTC